ncbi:hypothetical protein ACIBUY_15975 [Streptomyces sp. NPDC050085]|uniref:hypothetical protein n=1 Tax=Streptomyces sp. NPDC050085 TaxID=3365600 RepID=UPI0037987058
MQHHRTALAVVGAALTGAMALGIVAPAVAAATPATTSTVSARALTPADERAYEDALRAVLTTADALVAETGEGTAVDTAAYDEAFDRAFAAAPQPDDNPLLDKAMDGLKVQVDALAKAAGSGDIVKIGVAVSGVVGAAQNVLTSGGLVASIDAFLKPLSLDNLPGAGKKPLDLPKFPIPSIPGLS